MMCSTSFNVDHSKTFPKEKEHHVGGMKETYAQSLPPFGIDLRFEFHLPHLLPLLLTSHHVFCFLDSEILSRVEATSPHHRCGSVIPSPPDSSCFLAVPKLQPEVRHRPRNGDLCRHKDGLEKEFLHHPLPCHGPSIPPPHDAIAASWSMELLLSTPRRSKLSTAKVVSLWLRSSNDTCSGQA